MYFFEVMRSSFLEAADLRCARRELSRTHVAEEYLKTDAVNYGWVFERRLLCLYHSSRKKCSLFAPTCKLPFRCKINAGYHPMSCPHPMFVSPSDESHLEQVSAHQILTCDPKANPCPYPPNPSASPHASNSHHLPPHSPTSHYPASPSRSRPQRA
jgi:hypothetical protein